MAPSKREAQAQIQGALHQLQHAWEAQQKRSLQRHRKIRPATRIPQSRLATTRGSFRSALLQTLVHHMAKEKRNAERVHQRTTRRQTKRIYRHIPSHRPRRAQKSILSIHTKTRNLAFIIELLQLRKYRKSFVNFANLRSLRGKIGKAYRLFNPENY